MDENKIAEIEKIDIKDWFDKGKQLYGDDRDNWVFKCPICGNRQSVNSVLIKNPKLKAEDVRDWIYFNCEGRYTKRVGCDWTLGGLFQIHRVEVMVDGKRRNRVFEFADK